MQMSYTDVETLAGEVDEMALEGALIGLQAERMALRQTMKCLLGR
jgi:hypothetical protein